MTNSLINTVTVTSIDPNSPNYYFGPEINKAQSATLHLSEDGTISLGDNFIITVKELRACIKVMRDLARQTYPEDFI